MLTTSRKEISSETDTRLCKRSRLSSRESSSCKLTYWILTDHADHQAQEESTAYEGVREARVQAFRLDGEEAIGMAAWAGFARTGRYYFHTSEESPYVVCKMRHASHHTAGVIALSHLDLVNIPTSAHPLDAPVLLMYSGLTRPNTLHSDTKPDKQVNPPIIIVARLNPRRIETIFPLIP